ncbi:MAG TPA: right-handed parallel beta-helix repeat-containing protein, partial [Verrucomicrobiota bacterium]|nr:right-handed parallel beta-helix repeat-containing protein [Verrucomicrobiota bacterium]
MPNRTILNHTLCATLAVCLVPVCNAQPYYISPSGNDANSGTLEKPFATLQRAQQAVRQKHGDVFLRGGTYYLPAPLVFTAEDSGTKDKPVVFQNYNGETPIISGGLRLDGLNWQPYTNGILRAQVPADLRTEEIFINGER